MPIRERFIQKLDELRNDILKMGVLVEGELKLAMEALATLNLEKASEVHLLDQRVNEVRFDIESKCFSLIVLQQPAASDLRRVISAMNIIIDLERMGDQAKGIAKVIPHMHKYPNQHQPAELRQMGDTVLVMMRQAMQAFAHENVALSKGVSELDDEVDALYAKVFHQVMSYMAETKEEDRVEAAYEVLRAARELERFGDLATNIAERTIYMVTGSMEEINVDIDDAAEEPRGD
ncbi:MAG: phosphate signaling complex protein PhoU [Chloroflexi bacterium]|nr:phosphate signaling complex protein PhoU [Chloroflexota bacterium]